MWFSAGQSRAELALFAPFGSACRTTYAQGLLRFVFLGFHGYTLHGSSPIRWSILTIAKTRAGRIIDRDGMLGRHRLWFCICVSRILSFGTSFVGGNECLIKWLPTQTNLSNHYCPKRRISHTPRSLGYRSLRTSLTPKSLSPDLPTSPTKACSRGSAIVLIL